MMQPLSDLPACHLFGRKHRGGRCLLVASMAVGGVVNSEQLLLVASIASIASIAGGGVVRTSSSRCSLSWIVLMMSMQACKDVLACSCSRDYPQGLQLLAATHLPLLPGDHHLKARTVKALSQPRKRRKHTKAKAVPHHHVDVLVVVAVVLCFGLLHHRILRG